MVPASLQGRYVIRFTVTSHYTSDADIERDWAVIGQMATAVMESVTGDVSPEPRPAAGLVQVTAEEQEEEEAEPEEGLKAEKTVETIQRKRDRLRRRDFGLSLLLSNVCTCSSAFEGLLRSSTVPFDTSVRDASRLDCLERPILDRCSSFLLLSNVPMSPKFINGSFAAMFDHVDVVAEYARHISRSRAEDLNGCPIRLSPRRRLDDCPRQYSLDHSFRLQPAAAAASRQRVVYRPEARQASLDSKIEEIFRTPVPEEEGECDESGGNEMEDASV